MANACKRASESQVFWMEWATYYSFVLKSMVAGDLECRVSWRRNWLYKAGQHPDQRRDVMGLPLALEFGRAEEVQEPSELKGASIDSCGTKISEDPAETLPSHLAEVTQSHL